MSITPASINDAKFFEPALRFDDNIVERTDDALPNGASTQLWSAPPPRFADAMQSSLASLEQRFSAFMQMLSRQLASLERRFSSALRSMLGAANRASEARPSRAASAGGSAASPYDGIIRRAAARNGVDPALVGAIVREESGFHADAISPAGARGLMQLMPETAKGLGVSNPFDPAQNVEGGTRLLRSLLDRYDGRLDLALAAYNAGTAAVDRYGGIPPYPETQAYVHDIMSDYRMAALQAS